MPPTSNIARMTAAADGANATWNASAPYVAAPKTVMPTRATPPTSVMSERAPSPPSARRILDTRAARNTSSRKEAKATRNTSPRIFSRFSVKNVAIVPTESSVLGGEPGSRKPTT